jgi:hypothetical protein
MNAVNANRAGELLVVSVGVVASFVMPDLVSQLVVCFAWGLAVGAFWKRNLRPSVA